MNHMHVVFGTGPLGMAVMRALLRRNLRVRMVNRNGAAKVPNGVECVSADLITGNGVKEAMRNAEAVFQCANPPYHQWSEYFPRMQNTLLGAAKQAGVPLVIAENLYMYGDTAGVPLKENLPYAAQTRKGRLRASMATDALRAHEAGDVRVVIGRGSDFFGPEVTNSVMGERQIGFAVKGSKASLTGNIDLPHSITYIDDFGEALAVLALHPDSFGRAWHVPTPAAWTQRRIIEKVFHLLGKEPSYSAMGKTMMRIGGLFIPAAREMVEMMYEFEKPFLVDSTAFEETFHLTPTPMEEALDRTVHWYRTEWRR